MNLELHQFKEDILNRFRKGVSDGLPVYALALILKDISSTVVPAWVDQILQQEASEKAKPISRLLSEDETREE